MTKLNQSLIQKYNIPGPRYTSYPTVPFWKEDELNENQWFDSIKKNISFFKSNLSSVYIHLPYCESMCTFCGCHKRITKNHNVEEPYIDALLKEWEIYQLNFDLKIKELHLGGGTPTFFSPTSLKKLIQNLSKNQDLSEFEFSFEAHPNNTTEEHLKTLFDLGFKRLSLGVQDYDKTVQKTINRIQTIEQVKKIHFLAQEIGYTSISHDLVYGLPKQTLEGFTLTVNETIKIRPDRISLYSYAHVPWIKGNGQRGFDIHDLPDNEEKRTLYEQAKELFIRAGYIEIGMDHFALESDELYIALKNKTLHRNFMGYTTQKTNLLIGLGASSISDSWFAFAQNIKSVEEYVKQINSNQTVLHKGHFLSEKDLVLRKNILDLMCHFSTKLPSDTKLSNQIIERLNSLILDKLVEVKNNTVYITEKGIPFVRNVCMAFDDYLHDTKKEPSNPLFSKVI